VNFLETRFFAKNIQIKNKTKIETLEGTAINLKKGKSYNIAYIGDEIFHPLAFTTGPKDMRK
jgi:hypothetical protein